MKSDISLIKIDKIIDLSTIKPISYKQFSVTVIPATVSAFGFNLGKSVNNSQSGEVAHTKMTFSQIDWHMVLKLANASKESLMIESIQVECIGKNGYRCKSNNFLTQIYRVDGNNELDIVEKLLKKDASEKEIIFLPFLLRAQLEEIIRVDFVLETYKRRLLKLRTISFKRQEIKEPETYRQLCQKAIIKVKINTNPKFLLLKI